MTMAINNDLRERLAEYAHTAWAGWMRYLKGIRKNSF